MFQNYFHRFCNSSPSEFQGGTVRCGRCLLTPDGSLKVAQSIEWIRQSVGTNEKEERLFQHSVIKKLMPSFCIPTERQFSSQVEVDENAMNFQDCFQDVTPLSVPEMETVYFTPISKILVFFDSFNLISAIELISCSRIHTTGAVKADSISRWWHKWPHW